MLSWSKMNVYTGGHSKTNSCKVRPTRGYDKPDQRGNDKPDQQFCGYDKPDQHFVVMQSQTNMVMPSQTNILWLWQVRPTPYFVYFFAPCGYAKPDQHFLW